MSGAPAWLPRGTWVNCRRSLPSGFMVKTCEWPLRPGLIRRHAAEKAIRPACADGTAAVARLGDTTRVVAAAVVAARQPRRLGRNMTGHPPRPNPAGFRETRAETVC